MAETWRQDFAKIWVGKHLCTDTAEVLNTPPCPPTPCHFVAWCAALGRERVLWDRTSHLHPPIGEELQSLFSRKRHVVVDPETTWRHGAGEVQVRAHTMPVPAPIPMLLPLLARHTSNPLPWHMPPSFPFYRMPQRTHAHTRQRKPCAHLPHACTPATLFRACRGTIAANASCTEHVPRTHTPRATRHTLT